MTDVPTKSVLDPALSAQPRDLWSRSRERVLDLFGKNTTRSVTHPGPATPEWGARDILAHVVGLDADVVNHRAPDERSDDWTRQHLEARNGRSLTEIIREWEDLTPAVREVLGSDRSADVVALVLDLTTHEQDIRSALYAGPMGDLAAIEFGLNVYAGMLGERLDAARIPALHLHAGPWEFIAGTSRATAALHADPLELHRALSGRRSASQILEWEWAGNPTEYLDHFSAYGPLRSTPLIER